MTNRVTVEVAEHGTFYGSLDQVRKFETWSKAKLAASIVSFREDQYTRAYWLRFPKTVLVVMLADARYGE